MSMEPGCKNCYVYVLDTLADWEIGFITAELAGGRYLDKDRVKPKLVTIGNGVKPVRTMGGILITPDRDIDSVEFLENDLIVLPGADTWMDDVNKKILRVVSELINTNIVIAAICGATFALAREGLLNNRKHTSNDKGYLEMVCPDYTGGDLYVNAPAVVDDNLITATGLAPLEFSYEVFRRIHAMKEKTVEAWYQLYRTRDANYYYDLMDSIK